MNNSRVNTLQLRVHELPLYHGTSLENLGSNVPNLERFPILPLPKHAYFVAKLNNYRGKEKILQRRLSTPKTIPKLGPRTMKQKVCIHEWKAKMKIRREKKKYSFFIRQFSDFTQLETKLWFKGEEIWRWIRSHLKSYSLSLQLVMPLSFTQKAMISN